MRDVLRLTVLSPLRTLLDVSGLSKVRLLLADGNWLSVYARHAPLLAETCAGEVQYVLAGREYTQPVAPGVLRVFEDHVSIFTAGPLAAVASVPDTEDEVETFDRLAQTLLRSLRAQPDVVLAQDTESE